MCQSKEPRSNPGLPFAQKSGPAEASPKFVFSLSGVSLVRQVKSNTLWFPCKQYGLNQMRSLAAFSCEVA